MIITKKQLIKDMSNRMDVALDSMTQTCNVLENYIIENLSTATENENVEIKLFSGISLESEYKASHTIRNPQNGERVNVPEKILVKANVTKTFNRNINDIRNKLKSYTPNLSGSTRMLKTVTCDTCGIEFVTSKFSNSCRCQDCRHAHKLEADRTRIRERRFVACPQTLIHLSFA
jgi:nucleoid DNA-binding protein